MLALLSSGIGIALMAYGFSRMKRYMLIKDTPTSKIRSMALGLVEINGGALSKDTIKTLFSKSECVYFRYEVKEYRQHTHVSNGRTSTSYSWDTIDSGEKRVPFFIGDTTGTAYIKPEGAEFKVPVKKILLERTGIIRKKYSRDNTAGLVEIKDTMFSFSLFNRVGDRKYFESFIAPEEKVYIIGTAEANSSGKTFIHRGVNNRNFIISTKSEKELLKEMRFEMIGTLAAGAALFLMGASIFFK
jgi:hypothetical protein